MLCSGLITYRLCIGSITIHELDSSWKPTILACISHLLPYQKGLHYQLIKPYKPHCICWGFLNQSDLLQEFEEELQAISIRMDYLETQLSMRPEQPEAENLKGLVSTMVIAHMQLPRLIQHQCFLTGWSFYASDFPSNLSNGRSYCILFNHSMIFPYIHIYIYNYIYIYPCKYVFGISAHERHNVS